jgi:hypothetical protein
LGGTKPLERKSEAGMVLDESAGAEEDVEKRSSIIQ